MKTALEIFIESIDEYLDPIMDNKDWELFDKLANEAKEKEKQQIVETFNKGTWNGGNNVNYENGHDFYNQTYNQ
jgi:hypothetical protein